MEIIGPITENCSPFDNGRNCRNGDLVVLVGVKLLQLCHSSKVLNLELVLLILQCVRDTSSHTM